MKYNRDSVINEIRRILNTFEIKYTKEADSTETPESRHNGMVYVNAMNGTDTLLSYPKIDHRALQRAGITNQTMIREILKDRYMIPSNKVEEVLHHQRRLIIEEYIERNPYYRDRAGLPPIDKEGNLIDTIPLTEEECKKLGINTGTMLHQLARNEAEDAETLGIIAKYRQIYPHLLYIEYLGIRQMKIHLMRQAHNFEVIRFLYNPKMESLDNLFISTYVECREYFMEVIYNRHSSHSFQGYEEFIAMMIAVMTIQRVFASLFEMGIQRDFFDLASIEGLFETYSIPFLEDMDYDTKRSVMKNINMLIRAKATDKVLFDILTLLGHDRMKINELYLIKEHILDEDGNPIFLYKEVALDDDKPTELTRVLDIENMYRFYFQAIDKKDPNPIKSLSDGRNRRGYVETTINDPDWIEDVSLKNYLLQEDYNYVKSKYIDIRIMYKLARMIFEATVLFKMITDRKEEVSNIRISLPRLFPDEDIPIFDTIVLAMALIAKNRQMRGNIIYAPSQILSVLGYNFEVDFKSLREDIMQNPHIQQKELVQFVTNMKLNSVKDINKLFTQISDLHDYIAEKMYQAKTIEEWRSYKKVHETLFVSKYTQEIFRMKNGEIAPTFKDYLLDLSPKYRRFFDESVTEKETSNDLDHLLRCLMRDVENAKNLFILNDLSESILTMLLNMLRRFKSLTTRLNDIGVVYVLDSRYYNMITLKTQIRSIHKELMLRDMDTPYYDILDNQLKTIFTKDWAGVEELVSLLVKLPLKDFMKWYETYRYEARIDLEHYIMDSYQDWMTTSSHHRETDTIQFKDTPFDPFHTIFLNHLFKFSFRDKIKAMVYLSDIVSPVYYDSLSTEKAYTEEERLEIIHNLVFMGVYSRLKPDSVEVGEHILESTKVQIRSILMPEYTDILWTDRVVSHIGDHSTHHDAMDMEREFEKFRFDWSLREGERSNTRIPINEVIGLYGDTLSSNRSIQGNSRLQYREGLQINRETEG